MLNDNSTCMRVFDRSVLKKLRTPLVHCQQYQNLEVGKVHHTLPMTTVDLHHLSVNVCAVSVKSLGTIEDHALNRIEVNTKTLDFTSNMTYFHCYCTQCTTCTCMFMSVISLSLPPSLFLSLLHLLSVCV